MSGFSGGFIKGALISVVVAAGLSIVVPLDQSDPGKSTQVDLPTPAGSGFNVGRDDSDPVLPRTDQSVSADTVVSSGSEPTADVEREIIPLADTTPAAQPSAQVGISMPQVDAGGDDVAVVSTTNDITPVIPPAALGVPMPEIDNPVAKLVVNRLPVVKPPVTEIVEPKPDPVTAEESTPLVESELTVVEIETQTHDAALMRNKIAFDNPDGKPLMSIILVDAGTEGLDRAALVTFSFPVTFAIDPARADARQVADIYRSVGFEVAILAPSGDTALVATDVDSDLQARLVGLMSSVPNAVGLVDETGAGIQQSAKLADQVIETLAASGHGFVTYDIGLNAADQKARRGGIKSGTIYRVLDAGGENLSLIKRYLDRAALEAGKTGNVIVLGRSYQNTVTALLSWALGPKSSTVVLAPLSAVLLSN